MTFVSANRQPFWGEESNGRKENVFQDTRVPGTHDFIPPKKIRFGEKKSPGQPWLHSNSLRWRLVRGKGKAKTFEIDITSKTRVIPGGKKRVKGKKN